MGDSTAMINQSNFEKDRFIKIIERSIGFIGRPIAGIERSISIIDRCIRIMEAPFNFIDRCMPVMDPSI